MAVVKRLPGNCDLEFPRGDTPKTKITLGIDLTGASVAAQARRTREFDGSLIFSFDLEIVDAATGVILIQPPADGSAKLPTESFWDLELTDSLGSIRTILSGTIKAEGDVTRAVEDES